MCGAASRALRPHRKPRGAAPVWVLAGVATPVGRVRPPLWARVRTGRHLRGRECRACPGLLCGCAASAPAWGRACPGCRALGSTSPLEGHEGQGLEGPVAPPLPRGRARGWLCRGQVAWRTGGLALVRGARAAQAAQSRHAFSGAALSSARWPWTRSLPPPLPGVGPGAQLVRGLFPGPFLGRVGEAVACVWGAGLRPAQAAAPRRHPPSPAWVSLSPAGMVVGWGSAEAVVLSRPHLPPRGDRGAGSCWAGNGDAVEGVSPSISGLLLPRIQRTGPLPGHRSWPGFVPAPTPFCSEPRAP